MNVSASTGTNRLPLASQSRFWVEPSRKMSWQSFTSSSDVEYPEHVHSEFNLVVCLSGRVEVSQLGQSEIAEPGDVLIGNAVVPHQSAYRREDGICRAVSLTISNDVFHEAAGLEGGWHLPESNRHTVCVGKIASSQVGVIATSVYEELQNNPWPERTRFEQWGRLLLGEAVRQWPKQKRINEVREPVSLCLPRWQFVQTHEWMLQSQKDGFAVGDIAKRLGICASRFHHMFRASAGLPPAQYFRNLVMAQASERLSETDAQVKEISYELGFHTPSHFCAVFKKHFGVSPLDYRDVQERIKA